MGDAPLMELEESWIFGAFPRRLLIFEDHIEVSGFELLREQSESRSYGRMGRVVVSGKGWLASLVITELGKAPLLFRGLNKSDAERAKTLIEERVNLGGDLAHLSPSPAIADAEHLIRKLAELRDAGVLSREEFEEKRREVIRGEQGSR